MTLLLDLDVARLHLRVDSVVEDDLIADAIAAAQDFIETSTNLVLWRRSVTESVSGGFGRRLQLKKWPVVSITSVDFRDCTGAAQTLANTEYLLVSGGRPALLLPVPGGAWPGIGRARASLAEAPVSVTMLAGYATVDDVPQAVRWALRLLVTHFYVNRLPVQAGSQAAAVEVPLTVRDMLDRWKRKTC